MDFTWQFDQTNINWNALSERYKVAPLGTKLPDDLKLVFSNSRFKCFVYHEDLLIGAGRALADGKVTEKLSCTPIPGKRGSTPNSGSKK